ncbi:uncharacterized protein LOC142570604 isoform X1 [Dermacentor variabilis]|uniref:uncharacterized protein LOC142570604 isoform X1 n=1 Tax=Dermacentor variabilis TaxID=34621 RepID=UPI003F5BE34C
MGIDVPSGIRAYRILHGGASAFSEAPSPQKMPSSILHDLLPEKAKADASYTFGYLAMEDVLPRSCDPVVKTVNMAEEQACSSSAAHRRRLVPRAECDRFVEADVKDNLPEYNSMQAPCTVQGAGLQVEDVSQGTGHRMIFSSEKPITRGVEAALSGNHHDKDWSAVAWPDYRFEFFGCRPHMHLRDTLPLRLTTLGSCKAECNSDMAGMATPSSSCLWRLRTRLPRPRVAGRTVV